MRNKNTSPYYVKFIDFGRPPRVEANRFNPWDQFCHLEKFDATDDQDAENKALKIIKGSKGPFAILWNGGGKVKTLKDTSRRAG